MQVTAEQLNTAKMDKRIIGQTGTNVFLECKRFFVVHKQWSF